MDEAGYRSRSSLSNLISAALSSSLPLTTNLVSCFAKSKWIPVRPAAHASLYANRFSDRFCRTWTGNRYCSRGTVSDSKHGYQLCACCARF
jgi:hypothetical protein